MNSREVELHQRIVREQGMCGDLSPDRTRICILEPGHTNKHEWDVSSPLDRVEQQVRDAIDAGGDFLYDPVGKDGIAALEALVNVAKAAERARVEHRLATRVGPGQHVQGDYVCNADGSKAHAADCPGCELDEALSALNKEPA